MNDLIKFNNSQFGEMRTILNENNEPMFCLADVCRALGIANSRDCKSRLDEDGVVTTDGVDSLGRSNELTFINEPNLYRCIFQSRKPEAKQFQKWVFNEVLPLLRKDGKYEISNYSNSDKQEVNLRLVELLQTNQVLIKKNQEQIDKVLERMEIKSNIQINQESQIEQKEDFFSILAFCNKSNLDLKPGHRSTFGRRARKHCEENDIEYRSIDDSRYGNVFAFPKEILPVVFNEINNEYNWGYDNI